MGDQHSDRNPSVDRATRFRRSAALALMQASAASSPNVKAELLSLAAGWHALAEALEQAVADPIVAGHWDRRVPDETA